MWGNTVRNIHFVSVMKHSKFIFEYQLSESSGSLSGTFQPLLGNSSEPAKQHSVLVGEEQIQQYLRIIFLIILKQILYLQVDM